MPPVVTRDPFKLDAAWVGGFLVVSWRRREPVGCVLALEGRLTPLVDILRGGCSGVADRSREGRGNVFQLGSSQDRVGGRCSCTGSLVAEYGVAATQSEAGKLEDVASDSPCIGNISGEETSCIIIPLLCSAWCEGLALT